MAVTRRSEGELALELHFIERQKPRERNREALWLFGSTLLVAAGLALVYTAKTQEFPQEQRRLETGELINLNAPSNPAALGSILAALVADQSVRSMAQQRLDDYLALHRPLPNVGALARLRIAPAELPGGAAPARTAASGRAASIPLLPLARFKPFAVVRTPAEFSRSYLRWSLFFLAAFWLVHFAWRWRKFRGDPAILPALQLLTGIGLIALVSLRDPLRDTPEFVKAASGVVGGCAVLLLPLLRPFQPRHFSRWIYTPLLAALALFAALLALGSGPTGSDAKVNLGPFQPVEIIKILLVFFMAGYFARNWERLRELHQKKLVPRWLRWLELPRARHAFPVMCAVACALALFFVLKDMGPALVMGILFLALFAVARGRSGLALLGVALIVGGVAVGYHFGQPHTVVERVTMWLSPWDNAIRGGDQLAHALWAFATGGPWGSGPGWGDPSLIPAGHTDLILPAIAEEWGIPGVASVCLLFVMLIVRAFRIARHAPDEYGLFLAAGLGLLIALEMLLISAGVLGAIPLSGVVSPFLSSGNTAMLSNFLLFAILLTISNGSARQETSVLNQEETRDRLGPSFGRPLHVLAGVLSICAVALVVRAVYLEGFADRELLARDALVFAADGVKRPEHNPRLNLLAASIPRGDVYDRNGVLLATSDWGKLEHFRADYDRLGVPFEQNCARADSRYYPFGAATAHLLGDFRTGERFHASNASLIERDSNTKLRGYSGYADLANVVRYRHQQENPLLAALLNRNRDVHSTVDIRLQLKATEILSGHLAKTNGKGAVLMMNAQSGDVLALVSWPPPPANGQGTPDELIDRARYGEYPPGSTFKLVTAMAALRLNPAATKTTYACRRLPDGRAGTIIPGWRRPIRDDIGDRVHGTLDLANAIAVSCNAYFAQLGVYTVGSKALIDTASLLGINAGQPAQVKAMLPFAAYGQGPVVTTPLKMARVAATIADGGMMPEGRWVSDDSDGRHDAPVQVSTPESARFLAGAMRSVVTSGTAHAAMSDLSIQVAGKTGTAQLDAGEPHSWFAGFAPYDAPASERIAFAVLVEHGGYGAKTAAPIARELVEAAAQLGILHNER